MLYIENSNNQKLMAEYEKYQELQARSQKLQEVCICTMYCTVHVSARYVATTGHV